MPLGVGGLPALLRPTCLSAWVTETASSLCASPKYQGGAPPPGRWQEALPSQWPCRFCSPTAWLELAGVGRAVTNGTGKAAELSLVITSSDPHLLNPLITISGGSHHGPVKSRCLPTWIWLCFQTSIRSCLRANTNFPNTGRSTLAHRTGS